MISQEERAQTISVLSDMAIEAARAALATANAYAAYAAMVSQAAAARLARKPGDYQLSKAANAAARTQGKAEAAQAAARAAYYVTLEFTYDLRHARKEQSA